MTTLCGPHAADQLLAGDSGNRWFDKAVTLIVFADGTAGLNGEHCNLDGGTVIDFVDALLDPEGSSDRPAAQRMPEIVPIDFVLDEALRAHVRAAGDAFTAFAADTASATFAPAGLGADAVKGSRCHRTRSRS